MLDLSAFTQFAIALLVLTVAVGGAHQLLADRAADGGDGRGGRYLTSSAHLRHRGARHHPGRDLDGPVPDGEPAHHAALPGIGALPDKLRVRMIWITLQHPAAARQHRGRPCLHARDAAAGRARDQRRCCAASDGAGFENSSLWITTAAQMGMGFILPFALVFVAIPLETFVHSRCARSRDACWHRRAARGSPGRIRLCSATAAATSARLLVELYDLPISCRSGSRASRPISASLCRRRPSQRRWRRPCRCGPKARLKAKEQLP